MLAAVTVGHLLGWRAPRISTARMRLQGYAVWEMLIFLLNALLFVLIGLQLPLILDGLSGQPAGALLGWRRRDQPRRDPHAAGLEPHGLFVIRALDRRAAQRAAPRGLATRMIIGWCGDARLGVAGRRARAAPTSRSAI